MDTIPKHASYLAATIKKMRCKEGSSFSGDEFVLMDGPLVALRVVMVGYLFMRPLLGPDVSAIAVNVLEMSLGNANPLHHSVHRYVYQPDWTFEDHPNTYNSSSPSWTRHPT
jgi:hypothetical protein